MQNLTELGTVLALPRIFLAWRSLKHKERFVYEIVGSSYLFIYVT
jgi:hypothetical protein